MLFAKNKEAASKLSKQSEDGEMVKYYQAILTGELPNDAGTITNYLIHDNKTNVTRIVDKDTPGAKLAELDYEVLDVMETDDGILSYVLINLITGRTHQIRVQMAGKKPESGAIQSIIQSSRKQRNLISRSVCMHPDWNSSIR